MISTFSVALVLTSSLLGAPVSGSVFVDRNGNGVRDASERGVSGVADSDQEHVVVTDANGKYSIASLGGAGLVFVSVPDGYRATSAFFNAPNASDKSTDFALTAAPHAQTMTFVHASDTHISAASLARMTELRALVPANTPVVTFNHIPFFTSVETVNGYSDQPPAPSVITVDGKTTFRHTVRNAAEVLARVKGHPYPVALGGHMHVPEHLRFEGVPTRFEQAAAVVGPSSGGALDLPSGITVYRLTRGTIDRGTFVPLGHTQSPPTH